MSLGLTFVSNDRLLIDRDHGTLMMQGVPKLPRINPGTALNNPDLVSVIPEDEREAFRRLGTDEIWDLEHTCDVKIDECFGPGRFNLNGRMAGLVILNRLRNDDPVSVRRVHRRPPADEIEKGSLSFGGPVRRCGSLWPDD